MIRSVFLITLLALTGCTSNPYAPINQMTPIRQMDSFFRRLETPVYPVQYQRQCCCCCQCERERS
jgi:hypothetical protein